MLTKLPPLSTDHFPRHRCMSPRGPGPRSQWCEYAGHHAEHSEAEMSGLFHLYSFNNKHLLWGFETIKK